MKLCHFNAFFFFASSAQHCIFLPIASFLSCPLHILCPFRGNADPILNPFHCIFVFFSSLCHILKYICHRLTVTETSINRAILLFSGLFPCTFLLQEFYIMYIIPYTNILIFLIFAQILCTLIYFFEFWIDVFLFYNTC